MCISMIIQCPDLLKIINTLNLWFSALWLRHRFVRRFRQFSSRIRPLVPGATKPSELHVFLFRIGEEITPMDFQVPAAPGRTQTLNLSSFYL